MNALSVLDLFSAAAGGWSLGMHRAGFHTVAACEWIDWRRALYLQNNPGVRMYDDVRTLTGRQLLHDLGFLPGIVVGSPPCQDISSANTKGKGVEGERSGLYFEAIRIIDEVRPRWFALENSSNLRTRGADAVLAALEAIGYSCWSFVVRAGDIGANHERPRSWLIGCDLEQVANADGDGWPLGWKGRRSGVNLSAAHDPIDPTSFGHEGGRTRGYRPNGDCSSPAVRSDEDDRRNATYASCIGSSPRPGHDIALSEPTGSAAERRSSLVGGEGVGQDSAEPWSDWNGGIAHHLRVDAGLSAWVAQSRIAIGGSRGTSAASLIVEAFGDAVVPQIPEAIGRAILRTERALAAVYQEAAA